jgi:hypothetical protein
VRTTKPLQLARCPPVISKAPAAASMAPTSLVSGERLLSASRARAHRH